MAQHEASPRCRRGSLFLGPISIQADEETDAVSPSSTTTSPATALSNNHEDDGLELEEDKRPLSGPQRSTSTSGSKAEKEKRKRSRVTPEQLIHLERYFATDRSPTAARRREISELLGMQERQTQIWFQNRSVYKHPRVHHGRSPPIFRRAKAKLQDGKHGSRGDSAEFPPDTPPELSTAYEGELHGLIHEEERESHSFLTELQGHLLRDSAVTIIPCTDLTIGTWRRIATTGGKHDLVAYVSDVKQCLIWFIHSEGYGFKMEIPFTTVIDTEFKTLGPGSGQAVFVLSHPPIFYLENSSSPQPDGSALRAWKRCSDWTEGHQATQVLRHTLVGSSGQLAHVLRSLHSPQPVSDVSRGNSMYHLDPISSPMELPPPPLASLSAPFANGGLGMKSIHQDQLEYMRKRPSYGSLDTRYLADNNGIRPPPHSAPNATFPPQAYIPPTNQSMQPNFERTVYDQYQAGLQRSSGNSVYSSIPSQSFPPRPHISQQPQLYYNNSPRALQPFQSDNNRPGGSQPIGFPTQSPPLLTTPYRPESRTNPPLQTSSGMSAIVYDVETELTRPH